MMISIYPRHHIGFLSISYHEKNRKQLYLPIFKSKRDVISLPDAVSRLFILNLT